MGCHLALQQGRRCPSLPAVPSVSDPARLASVVNRRDRPERRRDMTKSQRERSRDVIELVDEPSRPGPRAAVPALDTAESFEDFYRRELPRLLVLARALAGDLAAEDVAQESMLVAYRQWSRISELASPTGYVRAICANKAVSLVRRRLSERRALRRLA